MDQDSLNLVFCSELRGESPPRDGAQRNAGDGYFPEGAQHHQAPSDGRSVALCGPLRLYIINKRKEFELIPTEADIVRRIFQRYIKGWGYKKIANALTEEGVPTPRMSEQMRKEAEWRQTKAAWAIVTV